MKFPFIYLILAWATAQSQATAPLWSFDTGPGSTIGSSPAVTASGTVYIATYSNLYAITNGGSNIWSFPITGLLVSSPAVASEGTIYIASSSPGALYAVNPDGSQKWADQIQWSASFPFGSSPAIGANNVVYIRGGDASLNAVSPFGTNIWTGPAGQTGTPSVVLGPDGTIYAGSAAIGPNGLQKWTLPVNPLGDSAAIGADGSIYVTGYWDSGWMYAISAQGSTLWTNQANLFIRSSAAIGTDGTIYVPTYGGGTLCAITHSGSLSWQAVLAPGNPTNAPAPAVPAIDTAGMIYYPVFNILYAISSAGIVQWTFSPGDGSLTQTSPAIGPDGTIYVTFGGKLYAIAGTNALADAPWPMYRQNARHTGKVEKPSLRQPQKRSDSSFQFQLYGQVGQTFTVESTTNFNDWTSLTSFVATTLPMPVVDVMTSNSASKFYRAFSPSP